MQLEVQNFISFFKGATVSCKINTVLSGNFNYFLFPWFINVVHLAGHHAWPRIRLQTLILQIVVLVGMQLPAPATYPHGGLQSHGSASRRNQLFFSYAVSGKNPKLNVVKWRWFAGLWMPLPTRGGFPSTSRILPGVGFSSLILLVKISLYLLLSRMVDSKELVFIRLPQKLLEKFRLAVDFYK